MRGVREMAVHVIVCHVRYLSDNACMYKLYTAIHIKPCTLLHVQWLSYCNYKMLFFLLHAYGFMPVHQNVCMGISHVVAFRTGVGVVGAI